MKHEKNEVAKVNDNLPAVAGISAEDYARMVAENMSDVSDGVSLPVYKPMKDLPAFNVGDDETVKKFVGNILAYRFTQTLWPPKGAEDKKPLCSSNDGQHGSNPAYGVECLKCKHFGFNIVNDPILKENKDAYCKAGIALIVLLEGSPLPIMVRYPSTSRKTFKAYLAKLTQSNVPRLLARTEFSLTTEPNKFGSNSVGAFKMLGITSDAETVSKLVNGESEVKKMFNKAIDKATNDEIAAEDVV